VELDVLKLFLFMPILSLSHLLFLCNYLIYAIKMVFFSQFHISGIAYLTFNFFRCVLNVVDIFTFMH